MSKPYTKQRTAGYSGYYNIVSDAKLCNTANEYPTSAHDNLIFLLHFVCGSLRIKTFFPAIIMVRSFKQPLFSYKTLGLFELILLKIGDYVTSIQVRGFTIKHNAISNLTHRSH